MVSPAEKERSRLHIERVGFDEKGDPVDTRNLFDKSLFFELFKDIVTHYYQAVSNISFKNHNRRHRLFNENLIDHLIKNMGIDHHMEEILRIQDQNNMDDADFHEFLISRGYDERFLKDTRKGERNTVLNTGPHLGDFNPVVSVPQLIQFLFCLSSLRISDRYIMENGLKGFPN